MITCEAEHFVHPIMAILGEQLHDPAISACQKSKTIDFDLPAPRTVSRWLGHQALQLRFDPSWDWSFCAGHDEFALQALNKMLIVPRVETSEGWIGGVGADPKLTYLLTPDCPTSNLLNSAKTMFFEEQTGSVTYRQLDQFGIGANSRCP
ncbi:hypothetical protein ALP06_200345 [Pseudomonas coronafaciens pv. atropurpurea]|nr:hypothetical protein ALP06_200345 [Pseudomonas coronafaciens pv. atropurpurea]